MADHEKIITAVDDNEIYLKYLILVIHDLGSRHGHQINHTPGPIFKTAIHHSFTSEWFPFSIVSSNFCSAVSLENY